ncbi:MAG: DegV family protein [Actinomycetota bacterium]
MSPGLVTDSNSQIPAELVERFGVEVVPITVVIDGVEHLEGTDFDADDFYDHFEGGRVPEVSTSQPSPGQFVEAYRRCIDRGCDEIVSVHVAESLSGTLNSARVAAEMVDVPVHLVDSGTASFGIACCVWQAGLAGAGGGDALTMVAAAEQAAAGLYSVTALGAARLLKQSGRVDFEVSEEAIELFTTAPGGVFEVLGTAASVDEVCDRVAQAMHLDGRPIRVALGMADRDSLPYFDAIESRLRDRDDVVEILRYRIGPSVGALTGPGTAGGFWYAA